MTRKMQRIDLNEFYEVPIYCPFCGQNVIDYGESVPGEEMVKPCPHTLFVATDEGFEYRSPRFNENVEAPGMANDDDDLEYPSPSELSDRVTISGSLMFESYTPPPGGLGAYVGFAPSREDK